MRRSEIEVAGDRCEAFAGDIVDHVEHPEALATGEPVMDEPKAREVKSSDQRSSGRTASWLGACAYAP